MPISANNMPTGIPKSLHKTDILCRDPCPSMRAANATGQMTTRIEIGSSKIDMVMPNSGVDVRPSYTFSDACISPASFFQHQTTNDTAFKRESKRDWMNTGGLPSGIQKLRSLCWMAGICSHARSTTPRRCAAR